MERHSPIPSMPPFLAWRQRLGLSRQDAALILQRTPRNVQDYDEARELPYLVLVAMAALEHLPTWRLRELDIRPFWRNRSSAYRPPRHKQSLRRTAR